MWARSSFLVALVVLTRVQARVRPTCTPDWRPVSCVHDITVPVSSQALYAGHARGLRDRLECAAVTRTDARQPRR